MENLKVKKRYVRPDENQVAENLKKYKSDLKLSISDKFKPTVNPDSGKESPMFVDEQYSLPLPKITFNSLSVAGDFEIDTFIEDEQIHVRLTNIKSNKIEDGQIKYSYIEFILDSYEDLLKLSDNLYTRDELTHIESHKSLNIEKLIKKNQLYKDVATAGFFIGAASLIYNIFKKDKKS